MISRDFEFYAPVDLAGAIDLLSKRGDEITVLAGGMSLVPMMNLGLAEPDVVVSVNHVSELENVEEDDRYVRIGAAVRHARVAEDSLIRAHCPALADAASSIGDVQVRNRGTIGGSIAHADPAADYTPVLVATEAVIRLRKKDGDRLVKAEEFFLDRMYTVREPSELLTEILVPKRGRGVGFGFKKLVRVEGSFAIVNSAAVVFADGRGGRLALGGVATRPVVLELDEHLREGATAEALEAIGQSAYDAGSQATSDALSDAEYRREMARVFGRRAVEQAAQEVNR